MFSVTTPPSMIGTIIAALVTDAIALAVAFGVNITTAQQSAILAFVGSVTSVIVAVVAWLHTRHVSAAALQPPVAVHVHPAKQDPPAPVASAKTSK